MTFKEFADTFMKEFFMEPATPETCNKLHKFVWAYLWGHPEFAEHREDVAAFWTKAGEAWGSIEDEYNKAGKL